MSKLEKYWKELQRRHVVKAGLAYLAIAWVITEVATAVLPLFSIPEVFTKWLVVFLAVGFPIWLILAWVYDFSWGSIQKTEDVPYDPEVSRKKNVGLNRVIIGGMAIAIILLLVNTFRLSDKVDAMEDEFLAMNFTNSLAILPFEDLSPNQDQRYFSDGLARSIYDRLARYKDLKLISPSSSFQYRDKDVSIEVIAEELDVRYVLEGSVQLLDERYRASINLVDTRDGSTIWSKTFDDTLENVLAAYDEVSENVGSYLNVTLTSEDVRKRKVDPEAYLLYLRAIDTLRYWTKEGAFASDSLIRRSINIDPTYANSHACLSMTTLHKGLYFDGYSYEEAVEIGLDAAHKSIELDPDYFDGYGWLSNWQWHARKPEESEINLKMAFLKSPLNAEIHYGAAHQRARQNRIHESIDFARKAIELNPKDADGYLWGWLSNLVLGNYNEAIEALEKRYQFSNSKDGYFADLSYSYLHKGEAQTALKYARQETWEAARLIHIALSHIALGEEAEALKAKELFERSEDDAQWNKEFYLAVIYAAQGKNDLAFEYLNQSYDYVTIYLEWFFTYPEFKNLHDDPRWDEYIDRLSEEFNYDFPHRPE